MPETFCLRSGSALAESVWAFLVSTLKAQNTSKSNSQICEWMWNQPRFKKPPCQSENSPRRDRNSSSFTYDTHSYEEAELLTHRYAGTTPDQSIRFEMIRKKKGTERFKASRKLQHSAGKHRVAHNLILKHQKLRAVRYLSTTHPEYAKNQQDNMGCC